MKTTVDIPDALMSRVRQLARKRKTSLRTLVEEGLRTVVEADEQQPFVLRDAAFRGGSWLQREFRDADWQQILDASYDGRGG